MLDQAGDLRFMVLEVMGYFFLRVSAQKLGELVCKAQARLAKRALLYAMLFFIPKPPKCFGKVTISQLTACIFLLEVVSPQRKLRFIWSRSLQILVGRRLHYIMWVGIIEVTELTRVSQPAKDNDRAFQAESFVQILSMM